MQTETQLIRKVHQVGPNTYVVALASPLVEKLRIGENTFIEEVETPEGNILLKIQK